MSELFGSKPSVPTLPKITLGQEQQNAIKDNQAAEGGASQMAQFTEDQILSMLRQVVPGFDDMRNQASSNINSELKGEIPTDVSNAVQNSAAARSLGLGIGGSGASRDLVARDLGLTSLDLMNKGLSSAESWLSSSERMLAPAVADLNSMFVTPGQEYQTANEQNVQQFQRQWMQNQINAMPDPVVRGIQDTTMELIQSVRGGQSVAPQSGQQYASVGNEGSNFGWANGTNDMFDSGFNYGGNELQIDSNAFQGESAMAGAEAVA